MHDSQNGWLVSWLVVWGLYNFSAQGLWVYCPYTTTNTVPLAELGLWKEEVLLIKHAPPGRTRGSLSVQTRGPLERKPTSMLYFITHINALFYNIEKVYDIDNKKTASKLIPSTLLGCLWKVIYMKCLRHYTFCNIELDPVLSSELLSRVMDSKWCQNHFTWLLTQVDN